MKRFGICISFFSLATVSLGQIIGRQPDWHGRTIATVAGDYLGTAKVHVWDSVNDVSPLVLPEEGAQNPRFSPDGRHIVYSLVNGAGNLVVIRRTDDWSLTRVLTVSGLAPTRQMTWNSNELVGIPRVTYPSGLAARSEIWSYDIQTGTGQQRLVSNGLAIDEFEATGVDGESINDWFTTGKAGRLQGQDFTGLFANQGYLLYDAVRGSITQPRLVRLPGHNIVAYVKANWGNWSGNRNVVIQNLISGTTISFRGGGVALSDDGRAYIVDDSPEWMAEGRFVRLPAELWND